MALIKSISGIRGTIGGAPSTNLTPLDVVKFAAAYGTWIKTQQPEGPWSLVIGRDARISGPMVRDLVVATLIGLGIDVIDLGLSTTPTVEMAVIDKKALGGIILTASHNPIAWNALKLLNAKGEFIGAAEGATLLELAEKEDFHFSEVKQLGHISVDETYLDQHIQHIVDLPLVDVNAITAAEFRIVVDPVNSSGAIAVPALLKALGVKEVKVLNGEPNGHFAHNPEPLPEHIGEICHEVEKGGFDLGIVVDPDVDRLALICENGEPFGEEYTLVAVADYILGQTPEKGQRTVSNLSSSMALKDVTEKHGGSYEAAAVGEVNVVIKMKETGALIGGEGNGGIIYPELHYGRDALVGIALFLTHLAKFGKSIGFLRKQYPTYHMAKKKIELTGDVDLKGILSAIETKYAGKYPVITLDGVKILFDKEWVHLRGSNTEPIIRIYAESEMATTAENLADKLIDDIRQLM